MILHLVIDAVRCALSTAEVVQLEGGRGGGGHTPVINVWLFINSNFDLFPKLPQMVYELYTVLQP